MACIITPRGVFCEVDRVVPVCETGFEFNGKQRRLVEAADDLRSSAPAALVLRFQSTPRCFQEDVFLHGSCLWEISGRSRQRISKGRF